MTRNLGAESLRRWTWRSSRPDANLRSRARSRAVRLSLEALEDRTTPSTFLVTNAVDPRGAVVPGSLRWAINQANKPQNQGSVVAITSSVGSTITLRAGELPIRSSLTVENTSGQPLTIQQGTANSRIFHVFTNNLTTTLSITGLDPASTVTLTGGHVANKNGGGILVDNSLNNLTLSYVNLVGNSAAQVNSPRNGAFGNGGGIYSSGTVTLEHSSVQGNSAIGINSASGEGGGIYADLGVILDASRVDANTARDFGGILNVNGAVNILNGSTVNGNSSTANNLNAGELGGGGIANMIGNVLVSESQVNNNKTVGMYSGGIVLLIGGAFITDGSQVNGNTNNGPGGGIAANYGGPVVVTKGSQVNGNTSAGVGGGIVNWSESYGVTISEGSQVNNNTATNVQNSSSTLGLVKVTQPPVYKAFLSAGRGDPLLMTALKQFASANIQRTPAIYRAFNYLPSNPNPVVGGGIAEMLGGPVSISGGSEVNGNLSGKFVDSSQPTVGVGGGVFANLGTITIDGSTISGNTATGSGGGIWNGNGLVINNTLVTGNKAGAPGGGILNKGSFSSKNNNITNNLPDNIASLSG
ncbi:polymorphic outer membrane protein repeat-containing protein [Singulisphaera sp. GP187]|uniref:hypothetical protein n=1 Tax=Singulisphaera sp. GP187 TaxID=1882752 RepID=UPI000928665A|nr:hypothetical protein [Singulisphaera sp. GP187]SIO30641.1 polymorphic outer membrane protein repeat-containing protein [Singulisphaera sp. GP187]